MTTDELIKALERMKSETGSLADSLCCLGCGHEHNCGEHGCVVIREAIKTAKLCQAAYKVLERQIYGMPLPARYRQAKRLPGRVV